MNGPFLITVWAIFAQLTIGCVTVAEKEKLESEVFDLRTRLLQLESRQKGGKSEADLQKRSIANSTTQVEKHELELRRLQGDIQALKLGVVSGELPGTTDEEPSVAKSIADLTERLAKLEDDYKLLMASLEKARASSSRKPARVAPRTSNLASLGALTKAFDKRRYKAVVAASPKVLAKASAKDKTAVLYLFAESLYKLGQLQEAALKYNEYLESGGKSQLAHVKMRMGDCFRHMGDKGTAKLYYEELVNQFPKTAEAAKAKERLAKL